MIIRFTDDERKRADININDHIFRYDEDEKEFRRDISSWVEEGNNFVEVTPEAGLENVELRCEVEE